MHITSSTALRNDYNAVSNLAHESAEPVFITKNGEGDIVIMSIAAYEARERMLDERAKVLEAEAQRIAGAKTFTTDEVRAMLDEMYDHA